MNTICIPLLLSLLAGMCTVIGSIIFLFVKRFQKNYLSFFLGISAGAMIYISFMELMPEAIKILGFLPANGAFFLGVIAIAIIDALIPHHFINQHKKNGIPYNTLMTTGAVVAIGIAIHNFPEGIAVFMSSLGNAKFGFLIAFATAIHNIPEGFAVAVPVYAATKSKHMALWYSLLAGIAEPVGAVIAYTILQPYLSTTLLAYTFAFVAGIMVYISLDELLPACFEYCQGHRAMAGIVTGMSIMALSLFLL